MNRKAVWGRNVFLAARRLVTPTRRGDHHCGRSSAILTQVANKPPWPVAIDLSDHVQVDPDHGKPRGFLHSNLQAYAS
jgi:hypothetical protein